MIDLLIPTFDPDSPRSAIHNMKRLADKSEADVLAFVHSDVTIHDPTWMGRVSLHLALHPKCGLLGFGGALGLGTSDIYKTRYKLQQLARLDYYSDQDGWETHGKHLERARRVTMLDGFALIFRREAYEDMGGWQTLLDFGLTFHMYDFAACCLMERLGWEVWALPISCNHHGGGVSVSTAYDEWLKSQGISGDSEIHTKAHEICYKEFRDILPWRL